MAARGLRAGAAALWAAAELQRCGGGDAGLAGAFLARRRERAWRAAGLATWRDRLPRVPAPSAWHRRVRWQWGAGSAGAPGRSPPSRRGRSAPGAATTRAAPRRPPSRVRGTTSWTWAGPGDGLVPGGGCCAALRRWCSGFRLGRRTGLPDGLIRGWALVPAAVEERRAADGRLDGARDVGRLTDQGCRSATTVASLRLRPTHQP